MQCALLMLPQQQIACAGRVSPASSWCAAAAAEALSVRQPSAVSKIRWWLRLGASSVCHNIINHTLQTNERYAGTLLHAPPLESLLLSLVGNHSPAMTAGLRGSSSGMSFSTLPTRSAPTSAACSNTHQLVSSSVTRVTVRWRGSCQPAGVQTS